MPHAPSTQQSAHGCSCRRQPGVAALRPPSPPSVPVPLRPESGQYRANIGLTEQLLQQPALAVPALEWQAAADGLALAVNVRMSAPQTTEARIARFAELQQAIEAILLHRQEGERDIFEHVLMRLQFDARTDAERDADDEAYEVEMEEPDGIETPLIPLSYWAKRPKDPHAGTDADYLAWVETRPWPAPLRAAARQAVGTSDAFPRVRLTKMADVLLPLLDADGRLGAQANRDAVALMLAPLGAAAAASALAALAPHPVMPGVGGSTAARAALPAVRTRPRALDEARALLQSAEPGAYARAIRLIDDWRLWPEVGLSRSATLAAMRESPDADVAALGAWLAAHPPEPQSSSALPSFGLPPRRGIR